MTISIDYLNKLVLSSASITDIVAFHQQLRGFEDDADGIFYPAIHTYKEVNLGGAIFPAIAFINGWQLKFPAAGSYAISGGNLSAVIVPVAGVYVYQTQSAAYAVTAVGGSGPSASDVASAVWTKALEGLTAEEMMRVILAALAGKRQGIGTATEQYMGRDNTTPRITFSPDSNGNGTPIINGAS